MRAIVVATVLALAQAPPAPTQERVPIRFEVTVPASTPPGERIYISGNVPVLGPWNPAGRACEPAGPRRFRVTLELPVGLGFEYKFTRGSWETVEKGPHGEEIANRTLRVVGPETLALEVATWRDQTETPETRGPPTWTGDVRDFGTVESRILGNARRVWVYLPPSYAREPDRRYPVVYFHDGQNVFDARTSFLGIEWQADETLERGIAAGTIAPVIAVAVANTPARVEEYTPARDPGRQMGGGARDYEAFLIEELKPQIDAAFRTLSGREHTALVGSSLGGLVSLHAGLAAWETFGRIAALSPSLWWAGHDIERRYAAAPADHLPLRMWVDMGTAEGEPLSGGGDAPTTAVADLRRFARVLEQRGYVRGRNLRVVEDPDAPHNETAWARRLPDVLRFLFPGPAASPSRGGAGR